MSEPKTESIAKNDDQCSNIFFSKEAIEQVDRIAKDTNRTRQDIIRQFVDAGLKCQVTWNVIGE